MQSFRVRSLEVESNFNPRGMIIQGIFGWDRSVEDRIRLTARLNSQFVASLDPKSRRGLFYIFERWLNNMSRRTLQILILSSLFIALSSQEAVAQFADNQKILDAARIALVNPAPTSRNFAENNKKHEILMAVIDTGVDYNHPQLSDNIHFELDATGKPVRLGWDFSANDSWPAPLVARSADLDRTAPSSVVNGEKTLGMALGEFLKVSPQFSNQMNPARHVVQEITQGLFHGTHVAGLMVYDEPRLGLMAYRALPFNVGYKDGRAVIIDTEDNITAAIKKAIQDGARVINLSLGTSFTSQDKEQNEEYYAQQLATMTAIKKIAVANPKVAFVAASGNNGTWIDDKSRLGLPCGIEAMNILCVGALAKNGDIASFSNIVLPDYPFLLAPGENIFSTFPSQFCPIPEYIIGAITDPSAIGPNQRAFYFKSLSEYCQKTGQLYSSSGTSMASPIAARIVAKAMLADSSLNGAQAIQKVLSDSENGNIGRLSVKRLRVEKPSWYPKTEILPLSRLLSMEVGFSSDQETEYFEFYTK